MMSARARRIQAGGGTTAVLTLNALSSSDSDGSSPYSSTAGIRVLTNGDIEEIIADTWTAQNSGTEWIDDAGATASDYEVQLEKTSGTDPSSGPALASFHTINATLQWTWTSTTAGTTSFNGTLTIREIADTGNSVSASVSIFITNGGF